MTERSEIPRELVTIVRPEARARFARRAPSSFPSDLFEQARGRIRLLAGFFFWAFGFDVIVFVGMVAYMRHIPRDSVRSLDTQLVFAAMATVSLLLWWAAGSHRVKTWLLYRLALIYEVVLCFVAASTMYYQYFLDNGTIVPVTWVPAIVIMFPLLVPGPPHKRLSSAIISGAMGPLGLLWLDLTGRVVVSDSSYYLPPIIGSGFAIVLAYLGARVIYGMGREIAKARAMGSYQLEERLGEGGMGEVWRAQHRLLARTAAVKLIRPALAGGVAVSDQARHRFEREAQAIARLRSPHTVDLFDFGVADDGSFYYAMELLEGLDGDALVRRFGPIPVERAAFVLRQICHSLSEAESCGLVHRDIKPSNIFLCRYGEDLDFVKVLDFGIVKSSQDGDGAATALTGENAVHGTPAFMAPEQALGNANIDGRADIYSLGCVAYWLLTGQLVFTADSPTGLLMKHIQATPVAPSTRTELHIPQSVDRVILACLAKDPADRPQSARALSQLLAELDLPEEWTEVRSKQWWEKNLPVTGRG